MAKGGLEFGGGDGCGVEIAQIREAVDGIRHQTSPEA